MDIAEESLGKWRAAAEEQSGSKRVSGSSMMFQQHCYGPM
jgi:hypothetical protein